MTISHSHAGLLAAALMIAMPQQASAWEPVRRLDVRVDTTAMGTSNALSHPGLSADGRWLVFSSAEAGFVADDSNGVSDVFVMDIHSGVVIRPIRRMDGSQTQGLSRLASISGSGRYIVFVSGDAALVPGDTNNRQDVFVLDRDSNGNGVFDEPGHTRIVRANLDGAGNQITAGNYSVLPAISDDGQQVVFESTVPLVPADTNNRRDVYLRNLAQGATVLMSATIGSVVGNDDSPDSFDAPFRIDASGRFVAFTSEASNLVAGDSNARDDVFMRDRDSDDNGIFDEPGGVGMACASTFPDGSPITDHTRQFDLSKDGDWVVFSQFRSLILPDNNPSGADIYLRHLPTNTLSVISLAGSPSGKTTGGNLRPMVSDDASVVLFTSCQNHVFGGTTTSRCDAVSWLAGDPPLLARLTDYPLPVNVNDGWSATPLALSGDGRYAVVITSDAANIPNGHRFELFEMALPDLLFANGFQP